MKREPAMSADSRAEAAAGVVPCPATSAPAEPAAVERLLCELRAHEAELEKQNEDLRRIAGRTARLGGWSVDLGENRIVWSDEVAVIHDRPPGYTLLLEEGIGYYAPEWRGRITEVFAACAREGTPFDEEMELITARGRRIWVRAAGEAIRDEAGTITSVQGACQDITAHKRAEEALARSAQEWQSTFDAVNDAIWLLDREQHVVRANRMANQIFPNACGNGSGKPCWEIVHGTTAPIPECPVLWARGTQRRETIELQVGERWYQVTGDPILDAGKQYSGAIHIMRDISDRRCETERKEKLEAQNRELQKAESLGRMAGAVAHHFNNQLHAVMGMLELALDDLPQGAASHTAVVEAMAAAREAAKVSALMLTYLGETPSKRGPLDLAEACRQYLPMLRAFVPTKVVLQSDLRSPGPVVRADANQIQQVLANLVTNAWEAIGDGHGTIRVAVKVVPAEAIPSVRRVPIEWQPQGRTYACLEVQDSGCGISRQAHESLFDPFFSSKFAGRGLGLAVVKGITKSHDGVITVESDLGRGSAFRVFLPVLADEAPPQKPKVGPAAPVRREGTILLVEDEVAVRWVASHMLARLGYTVIEASDGTGALEVFREHQAEIRCVLCDLSMPRMDGWETLAALRQIAPGIPFILSSGHSEARIMEGEHLERPQAYLRKPYELERLREALDQIPASVDSH